jgi:serine/threonine-protein kinase RsbW
MLPSNAGSCWTEPKEKSQHTDGWHMARLSSIEEMLPLVKIVTGAMELLGFRENDILHVRLAMEEAVINSFKHGNRNDPSKQVSVRFEVGHEQVLVEVEDQGQGFDPSQVPDPTTPENLKRSSGRGILMMRTFMTWIRFSERGNCVTLCKCPSAALSTV